eukprot:UN18110
MISATFHHFGPDIAPKIFTAATDADAPVFIVDGGSGRFLLYYYRFFTFSYFLHQVFTFWKP